MIYDGLDRASDKGPLRPAQKAILAEWHEHRRDSKDVIVKMHTGQGKTLIGLLILQAKLNEDLGRHSIFALTIIWSSRRLRKRSNLESRV